MGLLLWCSFSNTSYIFSVLDYRSSRILRILRKGNEENVNEMNLGLSWHKKAMVRSYERRLFTLLLWERDAVCTKVETSGLFYVLQCQKEQPKQEIVVKKHRKSFKVNTMNTKSKSRNHKNKMFITCTSANISLSRCCYVTVV